jgi:FOG: FHA domain
VVLEDEGSLNGTFVNGERIEQRLLEEGDRIQVGPHLLLFVPAPSRHVLQLGPRRHRGQLHQRRLVAGHAVREAAGASSKATSSSPALTR